MAEPTYIPTTLGAALAYIARGLAVVPIPHGCKGPTIDRWNDLRITADDATEFFGDEGNVGIILGEASGGLVDVDLDAADALEIADEFLPPTPAVSGRPSAPRSHRWYRTSGATSRRHRDPVTKKTIVELRFDGLQTVVGPSVHPSGERYDMLEGEPAFVPAPMLAACVEALANEVRRRRHGEIPAPEQPSRPAPAHDSIPDENAVLRRAIAYLDAMPPAISGSGGHNAAFAAATAMVHGFGLSEATATELLSARYNPRCQPPWSRREIEHKIRQASTTHHKRPLGWLRDTAREDDQSGASADLSGILSQDSRGGDWSASEAPPETIRPRPERPRPDFPAELLKVPGFIGRVMAYNLETAHRPQPVLALAGALSLLAVLAARKVRDQRGNRTNVYCVGVAGSGSGKEHARQVNKTVLYSAGMNDYSADDIASDAGIVSKTEQTPATLFQLDEFGRFLRTIGDPRKAPHLFGVLTCLMRLYSSAGGIFNGKVYSDRKRNMTIDQPCVSLYATTTPTHFYSSLTTDSLTDGFIARLLIFEAPDMPARQRPEISEPPEDILIEAKHWRDFAPGGNLRIEHPTPDVVPTDDRGQAEFTALGERVDAQLLEAGADDGLKAVWARVEEKACRLALLYACSRNPHELVIDQEAAAWGCAVSEHISRRLIELAEQWVSANEFEGRQKAIIRVIEKNGGRIARQDLCRAIRWLTAREREEAMSLMLEIGAITTESVETSRRPRLEYVLL